MSAPQSGKTLRPSDWQHALPVDRLLTRDKPPAECGDGYFVLGDDTRDSQDSRFEGPVERRRIVGRVWLRIWPPRRIGWVNP